MKDLYDRVVAAADLLEAIDDDRTLLASLDEAVRTRLLINAGKVSRPDKHQRKALARAQQRERKNAKRDRDQALLNQTGIRTLREVPIFLTPRRAGTLPSEGASPEPPTSAPSEAAASSPIGSTSNEQLCYVCQAPYRDVHHFYDQLCVPCGDLNYAKRDPAADLTGRVALVTGSRVKIGYQAAIMLLRNGARVVCVTRFPHDAARRYAAEPDFVDWGDRLEIYGVDLRHTPSVEGMCAHLRRHLSRLDFIINNACQTVRRPPGFYAHLLDAERTTSGGDARTRALVHDWVMDGTTHALATATAATSAELTQVELLREDGMRGDHIFPAGALDADEQQVDLRRVNSWRLKLADVSAIELLEVHLVNAVAPFIINARLKPLMQAVPTRDKHIVNVSAMEGQFYRIFKTDRHPHTNMAKAALNMMTRTSAVDYLEDGIHMNSVDTGWVTDEDPAHHAQEKREVHRFHPPLDIVDGAARIVDPIFSGITTGEHVWGQFLKDYRITDW